MVGIMLRLILGLLVFSVSGIASAQDTTPTKPDTEKQADEKDEDDEEKDEDEDRWLLIKNVDVHSVSHPVLRKSHILVKNTKIVGIGDDLSVPEEAEILDATGYRAYPGLIALNGAGLVPAGRGDPNERLDPNGLNTILALAHGITTTIQGTDAIKIVSGTLDDAVLRRDLYMGMMYSSSRPQQKAQLREDLTKARAFFRQRGAGAKPKKDESKEKKEDEDGEKDEDKDKDEPEDKEPAKKPAAKTPDSLGSAAKYLPLFEGKTRAVFWLTTISFYSMIKCIFTGQRLPAWPHSCVSITGGEGQASRSRTLVAGWPKDMA